MMTTEFCHNNGLEAVPEDVRNIVLNHLQQLPIQLKRGRTQEFRISFRKALVTTGWTDRVAVAAASKISITAMNDGVGMCLQLGNMARFYADLLKLQVLHTGRRIHSAIYVLPTRDAAKELGKNVANFERLVRELPHYKHIIKVPLLVIGIENEEL